MLLFCNNQKENTMKLIRLASLLLIASTVIISCKNEVKNGKTEGFPAAYLEEMTISGLTEGYKNGSLTVKQVVSDYISRIEAIDKSGPCLNSVIMINPDALKIAEELDRELSEGKSRGSLHGVPVLLKDNIDTHDRMPNTGGSRALKNSYPQKDSPVAEKLRKAGAVILGKANLSEWANFRSEYSSSGWSGIGGQTKNPYVLDRNPCGSSSGSGAAVSANLCLLAIGTETNGSIVCPSNNNGIVGIKPTVGLLSRTGIIPISFTQDTPGPMGRTVKDAVLCLGSLTGIDSADSRTFASAGNYREDYSVYLKKDGLKGKRIGLLKNMLGYSPAVDAMVKAAVRDMENQGAEVIEIEAPRGGYSGPSYQVLLFEFKDGLNKYLASLGEAAPVKNLAELIEFNMEDSVELSYFGQDIFIAAEKMGDLESKEYKDALARMLKATREEGIDRLLNDNKLDALMAPTGSAAWKTDLILGDHFVGGSSSLAAIAGYPSITVPMGFTRELPTGISFFGKAWSEPVLIEIAYSYEQATKHRKAPKFLPSDL
jgi:amidase